MEIMLINLLLFNSVVAEYDCGSHSTDCGYCIEDPFADCEWCPSSKQCLSNTDFCTATAKDGQPSGTQDACHCLVQTECSGYYGSGWCPSLSKCYFGTIEGPSDGIICPAATQGEWIYYGDRFKYNCTYCPMLDASNCDQCMDVCRNRDQNFVGWCPYYKKCYFGDKYGPSNVLCPSDFEHGQWISNENDDNCKILTTSYQNCNDCISASTSNNFGWCINGDHTQCLLGDSKGPWYGLSCTKGWTIHTENCPELECPLHCICDLNNKCIQCNDGYEGLPFCESNTLLCESCKTAGSELIQKINKLECPEAADEVIAICLPSAAETGPLDPFICGTIAISVYVSCEKGMEFSAGQTICASMCPDEQISLNSFDPVASLNEHNTYPSIPSYPYFPSTFTLNGTMKASNDATTHHIYMILSLEKNVMAANITNGIYPIVQKNSNSSNTSTITLQYLQLNGSRYHSWCNITGCQCQYTNGAQKVNILNYFPILVEHLNISGKFQLANITKMDNTTMNMVRWNATVNKNMFVEYLEIIIGKNISDNQNVRYPKALTAVIYTENGTIAQRTVQYIFEYFVPRVDDLWNLLKPKSIENCKLQF
eukprot:91373_1